jgi:hypothetical protein
MGQDIDFTQGGYGGDAIEETFKPFTQQHMEYWWQFREVLRAPQAKPNPNQNCVWWKIGHNSLSDNEWTDLIAISLTHYAVYTNIADAISFFNILGNELNRNVAGGERLIHVRRTWKAIYSSLYSSLTALSNLISVIVTQKPRVQFRPNGEAWNYTPRPTRDLVQGRGLNQIADPLKRCIDRMVIRDHLDHYGLMWCSLGQNHFFIDSNIVKGQVVIDPSSVKYDLDAIKRAEDDLVGCAQDFNLIYKEMASTGGYLDTYLQSRGWIIDYSDFGPPHNGQRPKP